MDQFYTARSVFHACFVSLTLLIETLAMDQNARAYNKLVITLRYITYNYFLDKNIRMVPKGWFQRFEVDLRAKQRCDLVMSISVQQ